MRIVKDANRDVTVSQVTHDLFDPADLKEERDHLILLTTLHPTMNEMFFAKRVVVLEERSAEWAIRRAAELTNVFGRHPHLRRDVMMIDCAGKGNIPAMLRVLNHFQIAYTVVHDEDRNNPSEQTANPKIAALVNPPNHLKLVSPDCLEACLGYQPPSKDKPYQALKFVEDLHKKNQILPAFMEILNQVYFGQPVEPTQAAPAQPQAQPMPVA